MINHQVAANVTIVNETRRVPTFVPPADYAKVAKPDSGDSGKWTELDALIKPFVEGFAVIDEPSSFALREVTSYKGLMNPTFIQNYFAGPIEKNLALFKNVVSLGLDLNNNKFLSYSSLPRPVLAKHPQLMKLLPILMKLRIDLNIDYSAIACPQVNHFGK